MLNIDTKEKDMLLDNFINKNTKDNTFTVKEIFKITKTLNYDFIDPIITSVFNDSYQYFTKVKTKINKKTYYWEVSAPITFNISQLYFTSKYDLKQENLN